MAPDFRWILTSGLDSEGDELEIDYFLPEGTDIPEMVDRLAALPEMLEVLSREDAVVTITDDDTALAVRCSLSAAIIWSSCYAITGL